MVAGACFSWVCGSCFVIVGHDPCLRFCFGWVEASEGSWSDGDFMHSALGDVDFGNIIQVTAIFTSHRIDSDHVVSESKLCTSVVLEFGEPAWLQKVLVCFCRLAEQ